MARVGTLLAVQLADAGADFESEIGLISISMAGLALDAAALLQLRDLAYGKDSGGNDGFLRGLERRVNEAASLVAELEAASQAAHEMGQATGEAARVLAGPWSYSIKTTLKQ